MSDSITLVSAEGTKITVPRKVAEVSELVKTMTEDGASATAALRGATSGGSWAQQGESSAQLLLWQRACGDPPTTQAGGCVFSPG